MLLLWWMGFPQTSCRVIRQRIACQLSRHDPIIEDRLLPLDRRRRRALWSLGCACVCVGSRRSRSTGRLASRKPTGGDYGLDSFDGYSLSTLTRFEYMRWCASHCPLGFHFVALAGRLHGSQVQGKKSVILWDVRPATAYYDKRRSCWSVAYRTPKRL